MFVQEKVYLYVDFFACVSEPDVVVMKNLDKADKFLRKFLALQIFAKRLFMHLKSVNN